MLGQKTWSERAFRFVNGLLLSLIALACLIPVWHVLCASFSDPALLNANRGTILWPLGKWTLEGYQRVLSTRYLQRGYLNTLIYVTSATTLGVLLNCFAAYGLSRKGLLFAKPINILITFTMLFSGGLVPTYLVVRNLGMLNTVWAIILPNCVSVFNVMIMRNSFEAIPDSLCEAAEIDGASKFKQIFYVTIPSILPTIMVMLILEVGRLLSLGFEKVLLMYTPTNSGVSDIIDTLVYRVGLTNQNYSYATAIGLFSGIIGLILVSSSNALSRKLTGDGIY